MSKNEILKNLAEQKNAALRLPLAIQLETNTAMQQEVLQAIHALPHEISRALEPIMSLLEEQKAQNALLLDRMEKQDRLMRALGKRLERQ